MAWWCSCCTGRAGRGAVSGFWRTLLTARDNTTYDVVRVGTSLAIATHVSLTIATFIMHRSYDPVSFMTGVAGIIGAHSGAVRMREGVDPPMMPGPQGGQ